MALRVGRRGEGENFGDEKIFRDIVFTQKICNIRIVNSEGKQILILLFSGRNYT